MKIKDIKKEDLELMSYDDLAYLILKEAGTKMKINNLFKEVCDLLSLGDDVFENKIADFFELLSTEKRFIMLENGFWDLRDNHSKKVIIDDDDDDSAPAGEIPSLPSSDQQMNEGGDLRGET